MAGVHTFISSIHHFFRLLWASILGIFTSSRGADANSCDIEAGIQPSTALKESAIDATCDSKPAACFLIPVKDGFVEIDLNSQPPTSNTSSGRPARHTLSVDPVKPRIVDTASKQVQDRTIDVIKSVIVNPGTVTTIPCSAKVEYVNLRIVGSSNAQIRLSKQSLAELSIIQTEDPDGLPADDDRAKTGSVKALVLHRTTTIRYVRSFPKRKLRAVQFALPPLEIPDLHLPHAEVKQKRHSDLFDLLDQFPTPPAYVASPLPTLAVSPEKSSRFARRYCIYRRTAPEDESTSSSGSDDTVLSISVSGDTLESSAPETPDTADFLSPVSHTFKTAEDPFLYSSYFEVQAPDEANDSPSRFSILPTIICNQSGRLSLQVDPTSLSKRCDSLDTELDLEQGEDSSGAGEAGLKFPYQQVFSMLSTSRGDGSNTTVDQLRAQLEDPTFESIKSPHSFVWFADRNLTKDFKNHNMRIASHLVVGNAGEDNADLDLLESLPGEESLEDVLQAIRETEVEDFDFRELFYRDSSFFRRSSLANRVKSCAAGVSGARCLMRFNESLESADKSVEEILAILNLSDPVESAAEDFSWAIFSDELGTDVLPLAEISPAVPNVDALQRGGPEDPFTWIAMKSDVNDDSNIEEILSEDENDQWHDAVLYLDAF